jgi:hypothetical protein
VGSTGDAAAAALASASDLARDARTLSNEFAGFLQEIRAAA